jgi:DNA replication and repair protein RecF
MYIERLEVSHCRNLSAVDLALSAQLNLVVGPNGAGKTSILEAVHVLARGRSFRSARIAPVIEHGFSSMVVHARLRDERRGSIAVGVQRHRAHQAEIRINGELGRRAADVAALMPVQLMLPDAAALVLGEPAQRRRYVDWGTFHVKPAYIDALRGYQRALQQRNALLRAAKGDVRRVGAELDTWTRAVVARGLDVTDLRAEYILGLQAVLPEVLGLLAPGLEIACALNRGWPDGIDLSESMSDSLLRDVKSATTQTGPHRADLKLTAGAGPAAATLSRGQAKLVACALHLAQARLTATATGRASIFLIDDLGAELDREHNRRFFGILGDTGCQVLATATSVPEPADAFGDTDRRVFHVEHGFCRAAEQPGAFQ